MGIKENTLITDFGQAEDALHEKERMLHALFTEAPNPIMIVDGEGRYKDANPAALLFLDCTLEELLSKGVWDFTPPALMEQQKGEHTPFVSRRTVETEYLVGGRVKTLLLKVVPVTVSGTTLFYGIGQDITGIKELEEQLFQAQKMEAIGRLAGGIAHDFNNLLTIINGYSAQLLSKLKQKNPLRASAEEIQKAGKRAASLTRQLLAFSRKQATQFKCLDINALITDMEKMLCRVIGEDIQLITHLGEGIGGIKADPGQIEQVVMNMAVNSRDSMPEGGTLLISTEIVNVDEGLCCVLSEAREGNFVCLSIQDTGMGMDEEVMSRIFEPFFTTKENDKGTGLGLSVVYGIVKQHEGWITVESEPGKGTTFKVYLPAGDNELEEKQQEMMLNDEIKGKGEKILLVEDEEGVRIFVSMVLSQNGYTVRSARGVQEAIDIFDQNGGDFHLILSDVALPDGNGLVLVNRFLSCRPDLKVILASGYTDQRSHYNAIIKGKFMFMQKPFTLIDLFRTIKKALSSPKRSQ